MKLKNFKRKAVKKKPQKKRKPSARRGRAIRADASIGTTVRMIEKHFSLPEGSVAILNRAGQKCRKDKRISRLLKDWNL